MGYLATNLERTRFGVRFARRRTMSEAMRAATHGILNAPYLELVSSDYELGLDKPVVFAAFGEDALIQAEHLPAHAVALRDGTREAVCYLYDAGGDRYIGCFGASYQVAGMLERFLSYSFLSVNWIDERTSESSAGTLETLYCDDGVSNTAGVDIKDAEMCVHAARGYASASHKPRSLLDLAAAHDAGQLYNLQVAVSRARFARAMAFVDLEAFAEEAA